MQHSVSAVAVGAKAEFEFHWKIQTPLSTGFVQTIPEEVTREKA
jgi:hypothetical protein